MGKRIYFDKAKLARLKKAYNLALKENKDSFMFEGHELLISYAKYLIEYLNTVFGKDET